MSRKNKNAGQPNRSAQMIRRADRREQNLKRKRVLGPLSPNLTVREKV